MSEYGQRLAGLLRKREAPMGPNAYARQAVMDAAPAGSVGAPGGLLIPPQQAAPRHGVGGLLGVGGMLPGPAGDVLGPLADAYMYATDPESRTPGNFAMSALGLLPLVPSMAGMFVGKNSKLWDALQAQRAQEMADAGVDARKIWRETGTWKGPDGAWRQEIDDSAASIKGMALRPNESFRQGANPLWLSADHPELTKSYDGIRSIFVDSKIEGADWNDVPIARGKFSPDGGPTKGPKIEMRVAEKTAKKANESAKSIFLHELQHAVQAKEGWPGGGIRADIGMDDYLRLAGEAEARATQSRMVLSPAQRRALFPADSYDVPLDSLIIRR